MKLQHLLAIALVIPASSFADINSDTNTNNLNSTVSAADTTQSPTNFNNTTPTTKVDYTTTTSTTTTQPTDPSITAGVKSAFVKEKLFGDATVSAFSISVETIDGVVHLTGTADNQTQIDNAITLSKSVDGVKQVVSTVKVKNER